MTDQAVNVAVAQFAPGADRDHNLATIRELATTAAGRGARLIVFPEYSSFFVDPVGPAMVEAAEALDGPFVTALGALAAELGVDIVAGMAERVADAHKFSNTLVAVDPTGHIAATYRKQHLYDAFGGRESDWVQAGTIEVPEIFDVDGLRVGLQTCYDLRFPELTRLIVDAGAELVLVPSEWVRGPLKEHHWSTLIAARAIENTVYIAAADHTPPIGVGLSTIVDPMGVALATLGERADVALAPVALARVAQVRSINPALALRRYTVAPR
ncbi:carbon-nitrogen hydrolase family protein [Rathayibacter soli]|uniref:carbon-nitrogen hydrolase family protein n=1 Tax=Rathayibacter soli TaxID=3144168 RepID=UPI0027E49A39|nr:carbon-nitrogen hydrolase family protein [Glaciibacter superstes]